MPIDNLVQLLWRRLVGERGRRTDPDLRRLLHAVRGRHAWQPAEPVRMQLQPRYARKLVTRDQAAA